jgi:beta-glucosidase
MRKIIITSILILFFSRSSTAQTYLDSTAAVDDRVQDLLSRMTLDEKAGQMTQADRGELSSPELVKTYYLGSVLSGGGSAPAVNSPTGWADMYDAFQAQALATRLKIPIMYGIDAVHGHNNVKGAVIFPHNIGMGCTWDPGLVREAARITALEVAGTGIDWTFAPCIAVPQNERWGRTYEGYGETAEITTLMAAAAVEGFQGDTLSAPGSIVACAKHFVGDGGTTNGTDQGNTEVDEATLRAIHLPGYQTAIGAGVRTVMASFSSWDGQKVHGSHYLLTDLLKTELGFDGFIVSDWNGIDQLDGDYRSDVLQSINAGIDMVMAPDKYESFISNLKQLVNDGEISMERIDDAVARILRVKFELGLFEHPYTSRTLTDSVGSAAHRAVARRAVRESMVLLKKENGILPLSKASGTILVAGSKADNIGYQCGGWTISWQGSGGNITDGTTILEGIRNAVDGAQVEYSVDGSGITDADVAVVAVGETPYAESSGDRTDLHLSDSDVETVRRVKDAGIPTVVILISGRPMILDNLLHYADILFAAWLPGTEGAGVADVLFGDYNPSGKLTHSWPERMVDVPINVNDSGYDPLFPYKYGIAEITDDGIDVAPVMYSALLQKNGSILELAFSKYMAEPVEYSGFSVEVNHLSREVSGAGIKTTDPGIIELQLAAEAKAGDSIRVAYTAGSTAAADGSLLESFDYREVYNLRNEGSAEQAVPGRVEAENFSSMSGIQLEQTSDEGGGTDVGWIDQTDWMEYDLLVADSGDYQVDLRIAALSQAGRIGFVVGGMVLKVFDLPVTGGWQIWQTVSTRIPLDQGLQRLKIVAFIGGFNLNWMEFSLVTAVGEMPAVPCRFYFYPNYPNPFNPATTFVYELPVRSEVQLTLYDSRGRRLRDISSGWQPAGKHAIEWDATGFSSGIYLIRLQAGQNSSSRKIVLLK